MQKEKGGGEPQKPGGFFSRYKPDQGRYSRETAFWTLLAVGFYGCYRFKITLDVNFSDSLGKSLVQNADGTPFDVPILGAPVTWSLIGASAIFVCYALWLWWFLNRPKSADMLIETEGELKKVTWPSSTEAVNASLVVIGTCLFLMAFIMASDFAIAKVMEFLIFK